MLKINLFNLIAIHNIEKAFKAVIAFIKVTKKCISVLEYCINNIFYNNNSKKNSNKNIIKVI